MFYCLSNKRGQGAVRSQAQVIIGLKDSTAPARRPTKVLREIRPRHPATPKYAELVPLVSAQAHVLVKSQTEYERLEAHRPLSAAIARASHLVHQADPRLHGDCPKPVQLRYRNISAEPNHPAARE